MPRPLVLLLIALVATTGCGGSSFDSAGGGTVTPRSVTLQLDWYPNPDHVGLYTAIDRDFFKSAGLDVAPRQPSDVSDPIKLVAAGRADLGISYEPELFFAQQQNAPVVAVAAMVPRALNSIIARGGEGITTPADLRGKTVGVDGSDSTNAYLDTVLRHAGLDPSDVHRVTVGFNLVPALLAHRVDAVIGVYQNIEGAQLAAQGIHPVVFPVDRYGVPTYDELVVVANSQRLHDDAGYRSMVSSFVKALGAGTAYAKRHPGIALSVMRANSSRDYTSVLETSVPETLRLLDTTTLDAAAWNRFGRWMQSQGLLQRPPDGAALVATP
ncbi:MAG: putative hydroxymethylpyrimidine transport system substrate-binding protein [Gaiellales bacterium]|jgi:putative hydroxymethylpyrimidine transport system substrate-binding protein|nr:putative hydroxymethylpyrimidine transport system substrate-binding protein [Gaiellales bacterium]MDX6551408.1 putative hydroxymethylpyrimidine transport system substrate-binding protein [Gaiellales bacterium]